MPVQVSVKVVSFTVQAPMGECSCPPKKWNRHNKKGKDMSKLTIKDFIGGIGHYCKMADGSTGYICRKICGGNPPRILSNCTEGNSWEYGDIEKEQDDAPSCISEKYKRAWNINDDYDAYCSGVVKIYKRMPNGMKSSKKVVKKKEYAPKKTQEFLNREQIADGVGHFCIMADGSEGYIARTKSEDPLVLHNADKTCEGWSFDPSDYSDTREETELCKKYHRAWWIHGDSCAEEVKVVKILDTKPEHECTESTKKSVLDLTVRELLEKIYEAIER